MSIIRRWQSGLETGSIEEFTSTHASAAVATSPVNTGTYSLRLNLANTAAHWALQSYSDTRQIESGFFIYTDASTSSSEVKLVQIRTSGGTALVEIRAKGTGGNNALLLYINNVLQDTADNTKDPLLWFHLGINVNIDSSSGWATVYKDGVEILTFSGNTGNADIVDMMLGHTVGVGGYGFHYFDDLYINDSTGEADSSSPILKFYAVTPNASGNYSQWLGSDGDSTNNYQLVDERPPNDSDYVIVTGTNYLDSYNMTTVSLAAGEVIDAIIPTVRTKRTSSTEQIIIGSRLSSTDLLGTVQNPGTSFGYLFERLTGTPAGAAWQQSDLDSVELLIASTGTY